MTDELREAIEKLLPIAAYQPMKCLNDTMQLIATHDKTLKQKLLAGLPEKKVPPYGKPHDRAEEEALSNAAIGYNQAIQEVRDVINKS